MQVGERVPESPSTTATYTVIAVAGHLTESGSSELTSFSLIFNTDQIGIQYCRSRSGAQGDGNETEAVVITSLTKRHYQQGGRERFKAPTKERGVLN